MFFPGVHGKKGPARRMTFHSSISFRSLCAHIPASGVVGIEAEEDLLGGPVKREPDPLAGQRSKRHGHSVHD